MLDSRKGFLGGISPLLELLIQEINVYITQNKEIYLKNDFRTNISHQAILVKEFSLIGLVHHPKDYDYHFIGI